jgi:hypothetical protein
MKTIIKTIILMTMLAAAIIVCPGQNNPQISAIQAKIYYNNTGTFSEDAIGGKVDLWNSPFDSSYSTLVLVEINNLPDYLPKDLRVELSARYIPFDSEKKNIFVRQFETIRNGTENGQAYAAFWLKKTGCHPVYLTARIVGRREQSVKETIKFGCGE